MTSDPVQRVRAICLGLPMVTERLSHGSPSWFVNERTTVASVDDHHHGADHLAIWCAAAPGIQQEMIQAEPETFFRPPYVGHRGWLGVRIDRDPDWNEIEQILRDAYRQVAPKRLLAQLDPR